MKSNTERGRDFQSKCQAVLCAHFNQQFLAEVSIQIADRKWHSFDLATETRAIVAECKAFTFTKSGNNPSAKITTLREAIQYLRTLPAETQKLLIIKRDVHPARGESLAEYFVRLNDYLLGDVRVLELDDSTGSLRFLFGASDARSAKA